MSGAGLAVFVGPSLEPAAVARLLPEARIEPPAGREDVTRLREEGVRTFLFLDGSFAQQLAVSPRELIDALQAGCRVVGAASMGAIRAAECWPAGMEGIGAIQWLYRWKVLSSDDEVAVAAEPDRGFRGTSIALVNVRFVVLRALRGRLLNRKQAEAILGAAKGLYFAERQWPVIFRAAGIRPGPGLDELCRAVDVKRRDAEQAVRSLAAERSHGAARGSLMAAGRGSVMAAGRGSVIAAASERGPARRYRGHDPLLGGTVEELAPELWRWLLGTGRYRRYGRRVTPEAGASALWEAVDSEHELEPELMRRFAVRRACALGPRTHDDPTAELDQARAELSVAHGFRSWAELECAQRLGVLPSGVPLVWVDEAAQAIAAARRNLAP